MPPCMKRELFHSCLDKADTQTMSTSNFDFIVASNPSFCTIWPETDRAKSWFLEFTEGNLLPSGDGFAVEYRYIRDICNAILDEGFSIQKEGHAMVRSAEGELVLE